MSETDHVGDEHLPPAEMAAIRDPVRRRLAYFRKYGVWISEEPIPADLEAGGGQEEATEISREHALARGCSPELVERMFGPSIHKKKDTGETKK
jgi:hypothetical protein